MTGNRGTQGREAVAEGRGHPGEEARRAIHGATGRVYRRHDAGRSRQDQEGVLPWGGRPHLPVDRRY